MSRVITRSGKVLEYHGRKLCITCKQTTNHTCFWLKYRKSETSDDAYTKEERWNCDRCHTPKIVAKEVPIPTEQAMLVKLLMSLSERYELTGTTISVGLHEAKAASGFPNTTYPNCARSPTTGPNAATSTRNIC